PKRGTSTSGRATWWKWISPGRRRPGEPSVSFSTSSGSFIEKGTMYDEQQERTRRHDHWREVAELLGLPVEPEPEPTPAPAASTVAEEEPEPPATEAAEPEAEQPEEPEEEAAAPARVEAERRPSRRPHPAAPEREQAEEPGQVERPAREPMEGEAED